MSTPKEQKDQEEPRGLVAKLCEVMGEIERIPKNGINAFHKYNYVMEADLVSEIRPLLAERNIMVFPSMLETKRAAHLDTGGKNTWITDVTIEWTFEDGVTGETRKLTFPGCGQDAGDKGIYKAITGSEKYFLMKTFLVATGDDPENDGDLPKGADITQLPKPPPDSKRAEQTEARRQAQQQAHGLSAQTKTGTLGRYSEMKGTHYSWLHDTCLWTKDQNMGMALKTLEGSEVMAHLGEPGETKTGKPKAQVFLIKPVSLEDDLNMDAPDRRAEVHEPRTPESAGEYEAGVEG